MSDKIEPRRRPRWILGTWWLVLGLIGVGSAFAGGGITLLLGGVLCLTYSVYLFRGGRFGFIVW